MCVVFVLNCLFFSFFVLFFLGGGVRGIALGGSDLTTVTLMMYKVYVYMDTAQPLHLSQCRVEAGGPLLG